MPDLTSTCATNVSAQLSILDCYSARTTSLILPPGDERSHRRSLLKTFGWYDVVITVAHDTGLEFQYAGPT